MFLFFAYSNSSKSSPSFIPFNGTLFNFTKSPALLAASIPSKTAPKTSLCAIFQATSGFKESNEIFTLYSTASAKDCAMPDNKNRFVVRASSISGL